jgi:hypothetical protein
MTILAFLLAASCPQTKMVNQSKLPWTKWDRKEMAYCQKRCPYEYRDAPCLKEFFKLGFQDYFCECGN